MDDATEFHAPPFTEFAGTGVTIAIVDSGVAPDHPHISPKSLLPGITVFGDGSIDINMADTRDRLGHGTAVTAAIQEKAPGARFIPIRVFHDTLRTSGNALIAAMEYCAANRINLVNLSLGSANPAHQSAIAAALDRAASAGTVILAAHDAHGQPCFPGSLPNAIGVGMADNCPRDTYLCPDMTGREDFLADGSPRPIPGISPTRNLRGISFAVANMTGFAARAWHSFRILHGCDPDYSSLRRHMLGSPT